MRRECGRESTRKRRSERARRRALIYLLMLIICSVERHCEHPGGCQANVMARISGLLGEYISLRFYTLATCILERGSWRGRIV